MERGRRREFKQKAKKLKLYSLKGENVSEMNMWVWGVGTGEREEEKRMVSKILPLVFKESVYVRWLSR